MAWDKSRFSLDSVPPGTELYTGEMMACNR